MLNIDYTYYLIVLLIITGLAILLFDVRAYKKAEMKKEKKFAQFLAWINMMIGAVIFVSNWIYETWFW